MVPGLILHLRRRRLPPGATPENSLRSPPNLLDPLATDKKRLDKTNSSIADEAVLCPSAIPATHHIDHSTP